jgi:DNA sulfur modification protein DndD
MTAVMRILGWRSEGLRCPDHEINLIQKNNSPYKVTLIQMPNGTGKTTTLELLRAALSGSHSWTTDEIIELAKKGGNNDNGWFEVTLLLNDRRFTVVLEFDFIEGSVSYKTTYGRGQRDGFNPPLDFRNFMKYEFVNFFVFDGELAENLLDRRKTDAESVVEILFQIDLLQKISDKVEFYWDETIKDASAKEERGLSRRRNKVDRLRQRLNELQSERIDYISEHEQIEDEINKLQQAYESEISKSTELEEQYETAKNKYDIALGNLKSHARDTLDIMAYPHALALKFADEIKSLKQGLDRVKLPESAAREFFIELADENECICGRPIDQEIKNNILQRANAYLASDEVSLLNSMKSDIEEAVSGEGRITTDILDTKVKELAELKDETDLAKAEFEFVEAEANKTDPEIGKIKKEIDTLLARKAVVEKDLVELEDEDAQESEDSRSIKIIQKFLAEAENKLEEITNTINLGKKRDLLKEILETAYYKTQTGISQDICSEANRKIKQLMPNNNIRIEKIEKCLVLQGQSGGSAGEQLSIAYGFLSTLFSRSEHSLPFIVDSPAGPIDLGIRPQIGKLIPQLTDQFVAFTISSEREGFVPALKRANDQSMQFLTVFKAGNADLAKSAERVKTYKKTDDGYVVTGEDFFNTFQVDEEE